MIRQRSKTRASHRTALYAHGCCAVAPRRGFSLLELLVVVAIAFILTGAFLPALSRVKENANRLICSANLHQMSLALAMYTKDWNDRMPPSTFAETPGQQPELMALHRGGAGLGLMGWEGLGVLYAWQYCDAPQCFYCPSHSGDHEFERYQDQLRSPGPARIYGNYHYWGSRDPVTGLPIRISESSVLITDCLRTKRDFNHESGMNVLRGDGSIRWMEDTLRRVYNHLPAGAMGNVQENQAIYTNMWSLIAGQNTTSPN